MRGEPHQGEVALGVLHPGFKGAAGKPNSLTVQEGWTGIVRMYLPVDVQETIDYIDSVRSIAPEEL